MAIKKKEECFVKNLRNNSAVPFNPVHLNSKFTILSNLFFPLNRATLSTYVTALPFVHPIKK